MGSASSQQENPSLLKMTFTKIRGSPSITHINDKLDWKITRLSLYQIPVGMITHITRTSHYFLLFDVDSEGTSGHIICHFTEDGTKHLNFYSSRSEAMFAPFEDKYLTSKLELLSYFDITDKKICDLMNVFNLWSKPFNLVVSNCRHFTRFITRNLIHQQI